MFIMLPHLCTRSARVLQGCDSKSHEGCTRLPYRYCHSEVSAPTTREYHLGTQDGAIRYARLITLVQTHRCRTTFTWGSTSGGVNRRYNECLG